MKISITLFLSLALFSINAKAADTWLPIDTGVDLLHRVETGTIPQDIYAIRVDLTNPLISIHASNDILGVERGVNTLTFANNVGAIAAINGDWGLSSQNPPISLAIGDGNMWNAHFTDSSIGGEWGYFGCTIFNECEANTRPPGDWGFLMPVLAPYRYFNAVGANGLQLINDGVRLSGCYDTVRNPRSAICVDSSRTELWMIAIDGRRSNASGMTCDETRDLVLSLGCWDAAMLDGGGSTTLVVDGTVRNTPSDGSLRSRPNHIGVILASATDPECQLTSGRWCNGTEISTCSGGRYLGTGDCAFFGATCEEDGDWAYCVHLYCPNGDGNGTSCINSTELASCNDGWYEEGDCGLFGLECGEDAFGAGCMESTCVNGPNSGFCLSSTLAGQCEDGVYAETVCSNGTNCEESGGLASCVNLQPESTSEPTSESTSEPTSEPTTEPTAEPAIDPTPQPTSETDLPEDIGDGLEGSDEGHEKSGCQMVLTPKGLSFVVIAFLIGIFRRRR